MRVNSLTVFYEGATNCVLTSRYEPEAKYPIGNLMCTIFQGEILDNISRILQNCINAYPMNSDELTQDSIEEAERYVLEALLYEDFFPAQRIAQGSFIRVMEQYRAIDCLSILHLLQAERQRCAYEEMPFRDTGFEDVGSFLRLCFNDYYVDLVNAVRFFSALAAIRFGSAQPDEETAYSELLDSLQNPDSEPGVEIKSVVTSSGKIKNYYVISSFLSLVVFEFAHMEESDVVIRRCQNPECRKFFTAKRKDAKYCNFPSPQKLRRLCKDYYPQIVHQIKTKENDLDWLIKRAKCRLYNQKRQHPEKAEEV